MPKGRVESFSDGVIAVLITIMVLELHIPAGTDWHALGHELPVLLAYVLSFVYLGTYWSNHHHMLAAVSRVNGAALWALATNPSTPKNLQIHTAPPPGLPGTNLTALNWDANPEADLAGYEVVMRETTAADWTSAIGVGNVTSVTLNISKDNVQFGLRAIDKAGHRSPAAFPQVVS